MTATSTQAPTSTIAIKKDDREFVVGIQKNYQGPHWKCVHGCLIAWQMLSPEERQRAFDHEDGDEIPKRDEQIAAEPVAVIEPVQAPPRFYHVPGRLRLFCLEDMAGRLMAHSNLGPMCFVEHEHAEAASSDVPGKKGPYHQCSIVEILANNDNLADVFDGFGSFDCDGNPLPEGGKYLRQIREDGMLLNLH